VFPPSILFVLAHAAPDVAAVDALLAGHAERGTFVGAARIVAGDEVLLDRVYGPAPASPICRVGSVSKPFTAVTALALADAGVWSLDDPIGRWVPEVAAALGEEGPSIRALLGHRGGLSEPVANPWAPPPTWEGIARVLVPSLRREAPDFARHRYSNFGYVLVARGVEVAAGKPFFDVLDERVARPLGLRDTGLHPDPARALPGHLATPLGLVDARRALPRLMPYDYRSPYGGDGALSSTPAELVVFARAIRDGGLLSEASRAAAINPPDGEDYALGWARDGATVWHNGALVPLGAYAWLRWSTEDDVVVAVCGSPTVHEARPEWRRALDAALRGESAEVEVQPSVFGWIAAASVLRVHTALGLLGLVVAGAVGGSRAIRVGAVGLGVGAAALGFGLTAAWAGALGAALAVALGGARYAWRPTPAWGGIGWVFGALGLTAAAGGLGLLALLEGFAWLLENLWTLG
jgi:CubicO group peptidase (beta-lactamase class C family)